MDSIFDLESRTGSLTPSSFIWIHFVPSARAPGYLLFVLCVIPDFNPIWSLGKG